METRLWLPLGVGVGAILTVTLGLLFGCSARQITSPSLWEGGTSLATSHSSPRRVGKSGFLDTCATIPDHKLQTKPKTFPSKGEGDAPRITSHSSPRRVEKPGFLQTCAIIPDNELQEMRGCYDSTYVFGLDVILNPFNSPSNPISVNFTASVPAGSSNAPTVNGQVLTGQDGVYTYKADVTSPTLNVAFNQLNQDQVAYMVGIGKLSQFSGIIQAVQVRGNGQTVLANTNLTVMIPKTMMPEVANRTRSIVGLGTKGSLVGLRY